MGRVYQFPARRVDAKPPAEGSLSGLTSHASVVAIHRDWGLF